MRSTRRGNEVRDLSLLLNSATKQSVRRKSVAGGYCFAAD